MTIIDNSMHYIQKLPSYMYISIYRYARCHIEEHDFRSKTNKAYMHGSKIFGVRTNLVIYFVFIESYKKSGLFS